MAIERESGTSLDEIGVVHKQRYAWAAERVRGDRVLDCVCGSGYGSLILCSHGDSVRVTAIDISSEALAHAKRYFHSDRIEYKIADMRSMDLEGPFDTIVSIESLEHTKDPAEVLAQFHHLLTPGGNLIVSIPSAPTIEINPFHLFEISDMEEGVRFFESHGFMVLEAEEREDAYKSLFGLFHLEPKFKAPADFATQ